MVLRTVVLHEYDDGSQKVCDQIVGNESTGFAGSSWSEPYLISRDERIDVQKFNSETVAILNSQTGAVN